MPAISVDFQIGGIARVREAFSSVVKAQQDMERQVARSIHGETSARTKGARTIEQLQEKRFSELKRTLAKEATETERAEKKKAASAEKASRDATKADERRFNAIVKRLDREVADVDRAESRKFRAREIAERKTLAMQLNSAKMAGRIAEQQVREELAARKRLTGVVAGQVSGSVRGAIGMGARVGGSLLALGGGFSVADSAASSMRAEKAAALLSNAAYVPGESERPDKKTILARASDISQKTGYKKEDLVEGLQKYVDLSSDFKGGFGNLGNLAKMAKGSGTDLKELMATAGTMRVQNPDLDTKGMMDLLRGTIGQAKHGAISFADLAQHAGTATSTASQYGGDQATNQSHLLGLTQLARRVADPAEAARAVERLAPDISTHLDGNKFAGVTVRDKNGLFDQATLISKIMKATGGDIGKLHEAGIGNMSMKLFNASGSTFKKAGGGDAGAKAVFDEIKALQGATYTAADVERDFAEVMGTNSEKLDLALTHIREILEQKLTPYLDRFADKLPGLMPAIERIIDAFGTLAEYMVENPYKGIGEVIAAKVGLDLANAGIGIAANNAIKAALASSLSSLAIPVAAMAVTAAAVTIWSESDVSKQKGDASGVRATDTEARDILARVREGTATPQDQARLKVLQGKTQEEIGVIRKRQKETAESGADDAGGKVIYAAGVSNPLTKSATEDAWRARMTALDVTVKGLQDNLGIVNKGLAEMASHVPNVPKPQHDPSRVVSGAHPARPTQ